MAKKKTKKVWTADDPDAEEYAFNLRDVAPRLPGKFPRGARRFRMVVRVTVYDQRRRAVLRQFDRIILWTVPRGADQETWWREYYAALRRIEDDLDELEEAGLYESVDITVLEIRDITKRRKRRAKKAKKPSRRGARARRKPIRGRKKISARRTQKRKRALRRLSARVGKRKNPAVGT